MDHLIDPAAERAVIAGVFAYGANAYLDIADIVTSRTFGLDSNQTIWACLDHIFKEAPDATPDYPSVMSAAKSLGVNDILDKPEEKQHLRAVMNMPVQLSNVRRLAGKIRKLEIGRLLDAQMGEAQINLRGISGDEPIDKILSMAEEPIFDLTSLLTGAQADGPRLMGAGAREYIQFLIDNPREQIGISTGMKWYDFAIGGGLRPNSLDIIMARPKTGKTMVVDNTGLYIAGNQIPVLNLDTEMSWEEHLHRIIGNLAGVEIRDIETGKCNIGDLDGKQRLDATDRLAMMPYYYECIIGKGFEEVLSSMRRWVTRTVGLDANGKAKPCVIIYDYLKMLSGEFINKNMQEYQALGFITTALKNFMGRYGVPCLCFAQMNREGIDKEDTDVVSGSDRIVHYCTSLSIYKWKSDEERADAIESAHKYTHKLVPLISRHGEGLKDKDYINIHADYRHGRVVEGPLKSEMEKKSSEGQPEGVVVEDDDTEVSF